MYNCPICRQEDAVGNADANNLDQALQNFMLLYFPKEIKEKRKENEQEQASLNKKITSTARNHHTLASRRMDYTVGRTSSSSSSSCNIM
jgi:E3 ubiquitin-protein ligase BAH